MDENGDVNSCTKCPKLVECRSQIVNGVGSLEAELMIVGEGPGANEDDEGEPFVGRSGTVLDNTLQDIGLSREQVRISNCVRCRPPENRNPTQEELDNCFDYLKAEIALVKPDVVLCLGSVPSERLVGEPVAVTKQCGKMKQKSFNGYSTDVMIGLHPAFILRDGSYRDDFERTVEKAADRAIDDRGTDLDDFI